MANGIDSAILKAKFGSDLRKTEIHHTQDLNFNDLILMMQRIFQIKSSVGVSLKYRDNEDDWITLANDDDVGFALRHEPRLYIEVFCNERSSRSSSPVTSDSALTTRVSTKEDTKEEEVDGVQSALNNQHEHHQQQPTPTFVNNSVQSGIGGGVQPPPPASFGDGTSPQLISANAPPTSGYQHQQPQQNTGIVPPPANVPASFPSPYPQQQQSPYWSTTPADGGVQPASNNQNNQHEHQQQQPTPTFGNSVSTGLGGGVQPPASFGGGMPPQPISANAPPTYLYHHQQPQQNTGIAPPPASVPASFPSPYQQQQQSPYWSTAPADGGAGVQPAFSNQQHQQQQSTPTFGNVPIVGGAQPQRPPSFGGGAPPPPPVSSVIGNAAGNPFARTSQAPRRGYYN